MAVSDLLERMRIGEDPTPDQDGPDEEPDVLDFSEPVEPDPKPSRTKSKTKAESPKVTASLRREIKGKLEVGILFGAAIWAQRDPYCAGVLNAQTEEITDRLTAVVCRSPKMLNWLTSTGEYTDWIMLLTAVTPVITAIWSHHIAGTISEEMINGHPVDHPPVNEPWPGEDTGPEAWAGYRL